MNSDKNLLLFYKEEAYTIKESKLKSIVFNELESIIFEKHERAIKNAKILSEAKKFLLKEAKVEANKFAKKSGKLLSVVTEGIKEFFSALGRWPAKAIGLFIRGLKAGWLKGRYNIPDEELNRILNDYKKNQANPQAAVRVVYGDLVKAGVPDADAKRLATELPRAAENAAGKVASDASPIAGGPNPVDPRTDSPQSATADASGPAAAPEAPKEDEELKKKIEEYIKTLYATNASVGGPEHGIQIGTFARTAESQKQFIPYSGQNISDQFAHVDKIINALKTNNLWRKARIDPDERATKVTIEDISKAPREPGLNVSQTSIEGNEKAIAAKVKKIVDSVVAAKNPLIPRRAETKFKNMSDALINSLSKENLIDGVPQEYERAGDTGIVVRTKIPIPGTPGKTYIAWISREDLMLHWGGAGLSNGGEESEDTGADASATSAEIAESTQKLFRLNGKNFKLIK